jgi:hypothetical protein
MYRLAFSTRIQQLRSSLSYNVKTASLLPCFLKFEHRDLMFPSPSTCSWVSKAVTLPFHPPEAQQVLTPSLVLYPLYLAVEWDLIEVQCSRYLLVAPWLRSSFVRCLCFPLSSGLKVADRSVRGSSGGKTPPEVSKCL